MGAFNFNLGWRGLVVWWLGLTIDVFLVGGVETRGKVLGWGLVLYLSGYSYIHSTCIVCNMCYTALYVFIFLCTGGTISTCKLSA